MQKEVIIATQFQVVDASDGEQDVLSNKDFIPNSEVALGKDKFSMLLGSKFLR
jgi:hypothetical protein